MELEGAKNVVLHICKQLVYQLRNSFLIDILGYPSG
jgi:hypothetical protein